MIWRLRQFELDEARFELRRDGERIPIAPKPLALLLHLAKRYPASATQDELLQAIWPDVRVTKASLARAVLAARRAIESEREAESAIRTIRGRGYAFADSCSLASSYSQSSVSPAQDPFVGRHRELSRLELAFDRAELGHGSLLFVGGEPGIGKSRLLQELAARATERRALVVVGHCAEDAGAPTYWPWPEILRGLRSECEDPDTVAALDEVLLALDPRAPGDRSGRSSRAEPADADMRFRLFHEVTDLLRRVAANRAVVIAIEDLHWADGALQLLRFAGRALSKSSALIAATYRSSCPRPSPILESTLGELSALWHAVPQLLLTGLSPDEIDEYVQSTTGWSGDSEVLRRLHGASGGNPLLLRELTSSPTSSNGTREEDVHIQVPSGVTHLLRVHLKRLSQPTRGLLEIASIIGPTFAPRVLSRVSKRRLEKVSEQIDEARKQRLILLEPSGQLRFRHEVLRAALVQSMHVDRRAHIQRCLARVTEKNGNGEPSPTENTDAHRARLRVRAGAFGPSRPSSPVAGSRPARPSARHVRLRAP